MLTVYGNANDDLLFSVVCRSTPFSEIVPASRFVVEAVTNDEYAVDDEYVNVCTPPHVFEVDVPNANEMLFAEICRG